VGLLDGTSCTVETEGGVGPEAADGELESGGDAVI
jgi:hypothetical protein